jgi:hypothetical protein
MDGDEMVAEFIDTPTVVVGGWDWIPHYGAALVPAIGIHYLGT